MMQAIYLRMYLSGYSGRMLPVWLRRMVAGSELHRAWLSGRLGVFEQDGVRFGPAAPYDPSRLTGSYRKGAKV